MSDYTPTADDVKARYAASRVLDPQVYRVAEAEFDRWLAEHDAEVRAETLWEAAEGLESGIWPEGDEAGVKGAARELQYRADRIEREEQDRG